MKFGWRGALGVAVSAATIWWLVARSGIAWGAAWDTIRHANWALLVLASATGTLMGPLRAIRWGVILDPVASGHRVPFWSRWRATAIGMMGNNILPLRGGEFARAFALSRLEPEIPFATSFASLFVDRAFDSVVVLIFLLIAIFSPSFPHGAMLGTRSVQAYAMGLTVVVAAIAVGLYSLVFFPEQLIGVWRFLSHRMVPRFHEPGERILRRFADGLSVLQHPARFAQVLFWTAAHWLAQALAFWIGFKALGVQAPFMATLFVQTLICFAVALPSAPGFIGIFEKMGTLALAVYGVDQSAGAAWTIAYHAVSIIPITLIGLWYVWSMGLSLGEIGTKVDSDA